MLQSNKALARKVAREKLIQEEMSQAQEDEVSRVTMSLQVKKR